MCIELVGQQNVAPMARIISGIGKGTGNGHYGICPGWYGYWFSTNYRIGSVGVDSDA